MMPEVLIERLYDDVIIPARTHEGDAGMDIRAYLMGGTNPVTRINPGEIAKIPCGFKIAMPLGYEAQIRTRSGLATKGIVVANSPGTVDSGFRGEVMVLLLNLNGYPITVDHGDRIAQMVIKKIEPVTFKEVRSIGESDRGTRGFGSSGV